MADGENSSWELDQAKLVETLLKEGMLGAFVADFLLVPATINLHDAERALAAGIDSAASLLCRAAMENAMFAFLNGRADPDSPLLLTMEAPRLLDGNIRDVSFEELRRAVLARNVLPKDEADALHAIQRHGNEIAHTLSAFTRAVAKLPKDRTGYEKFMRPEKGEAARDVRNANAILTRLRRALAERTDQEQEKRTAGV